jgi:hypothetical protein
MPLGPNLGYKLFTTGDVLTAAQVQHNLANQSVLFYATAAARDADTALTAALTEGMFCYLADTNQVQFYTGSAWVGLFGGGGSLPTLTSPKESNVVSATAATGTVNVDVATASVLIYTTNASGNWTLNVRGNSTTTLDSLMSTGQQISVVFESPNGATAYYPTALNIDGSAVTPKWLGGTAPASGNINSTDVYVYTIRKTGSATFTVLASQNKFA